MKLHYSQTHIELPHNLPLFDYHMKLHYSQTNSITFFVSFTVWLPYEITLLSNGVIKLVKEG